LSYTRSIPCFSINNILL